MVQCTCIYIIIVVDLSNPIVKIPRVVVSCVLLPAVIKDSWQELTSLLSYIPASYHVHDIIYSMIM